MAVPKHVRARPVSRSDVTAYLAKADQYLGAASDSLVAGRTIAATSLAVHAGTNAADALSGARLGVRAAGENHDQVLLLLRQAGPEGTAVARDLARLLPVKARAEYDPDDVAPAVASRAVEQARRCVSTACRVVFGT